MRHSVTLGDRCEASTCSSSGRTQAANAPARATRRRMSVAARHQDSHQPNDSHSRRVMLAAVLALPTSLQWARGAAASELVTPSQGSAAAPAAPPAPEPTTTFRGTDFLVRVPPGFTRVIDEPDPGVDPNKPRSTLDGEGADKPIQVRFVSVDGKQAVTVLSRGASRIKPTFLQVNDISQYGSLQEVADLLLPRGASVLAADVATVALPPRDTGSFLGVTNAPPETIYRYEVQLTNGLRLATAVAATRGTVYLCSASAPNDQWAASGPALRQAMESFLLTPRYRVAT